MSRQKSPKRQENLKLAGKLSGLAIQMGLTIYMGNLLGSWLERKYNFSFAEEGITFVAVLMAMYLMIKQAIDLNK
ncbi:MAG: AtpZ/AtpI family protein [Croceivirga sp.]